MRSILRLTLVLGILAAPAAATIRWSPEEAARARADFLSRGRGEVPPAPFTFSGDNLADFEQAAWFVAGMQVADTLDPEYGGIREAEHLPNIVQTDNTSESIWFFSRFFELTGDTSLMGKLAASWTYVTNHPAYNEEGGSDNVGGYYRLYNCGWALRAEMKYVDVFGDTTHKAYVDSCASYVANHNLIRLGTTGFYDRVNPPVLAWAAGNLYAYALREGNAVWQEAAWKRGRRVKNWAEADSLMLSNEEWAMSGGASMWGMLESYFREYPAEESLWVAQHFAELDTIADPGSWENAWNGWYALGMKRLEESTGDPVWGVRHRNMTDYLRAFDTDDDGGIQAAPADTDTMDQAWVTSYLGFMGFDPLLAVDVGIAAGGGEIVPSPVLLLPNRPNPFNPRTSIPFRLERPGRVVLDIFDPAGRRIARLVEGNRAAGAHTVTWSGEDDRGASLPSGVYFYRLDAGPYTETRKMLLLR